MTKEALTLALEALNTPKPEDSYPPLWRAYKATIDTAITAIKEALAQPERDYERGFIDGMQKQMQSSVDKAVNAMPQRTWVGLTDEELMQCLDQGYGINMRFDGFARIIEAKLKEKNT